MTLNHESTRCNPTNAVGGSFISNPVQSSQGEWISAVGRLGMNNPPTALVGFVALAPDETCGGQIGSYALRPLVGFVALAPDERASGFFNSLLA